MHYVLFNAALKWPQEDRERGEVNRRCDDEIERARDQGKERVRDERETGSVRVKEGATERKGVR